MTLGGMKAKIEFDQDAELFRGEIPRLTGSADFYGNTVAALKRDLLTVQEILEVGGAFFLSRGVLLKWNVVEGEGE